MTTERPRTPATEVTRPVPVVVPRQLGPYTLAERLGEGGMGVVWRATDEGRGGREVAVKVLREHIAHDEHARARLRREVHTLARVHHPRIASVIDADVDGPAPYIVTEYVPGPPLDQVVAERGPLQGEELLRLGRGLGEALHAIHAAGIVHRDLKPGNVLLVPGPDGLLEPVVIDFGIAQVADDVRLTATGLVMGTPGYLSPEIVEGGSVSEATDWWGWAATLAYAASGRPPFGRGQLTVVLDRVLRGRVQLEGVDPELAPLLQAALDPDPARRPSEAQVLDGLERYARHEDVTGALPVWMTQAEPVDATRVHAAPERTRVAPVRPETAGQAWPEPAGQAWPETDRGDGAAYPLVPQAPLPGEQGGPDPRLGRSSRRGTLAALLVGFVGLAATAPLLAWALYAVWGVLARTVDKSLTTLVLRRHQAGPRRSDVPVLVLASPWHLLWAALETVLSVLLAAGLAAVIAVVSAGLLSTSGVVRGLAPGLPLVVGAASLVGAFVGWWGLASTSLRRGSRTVLRATVPNGPPTLILVTLCLVGGVALLVWGVLDGRSVSWWPLGPDFDPRGLLPGFF
ncbi:serine/threonine-protein kinase [Ornithinimicrobium tianjinense]|uniref:serine/threonine-protein kinase n=1 Tax=Ornithinimicrobium tianjinense TaxID=1195761 RepID=UPI00166B1295|nr:serine/threonine-protein kinase [Ornithinimicrobium tianjinense]